MAALPTGKLCRNYSLKGLKNEKKGRLISILVTAFITAVILTAGCEEQQAENPKKSRLTAEELEKKDVEIAKLKKALETCELEKIKAQKDAEKQLNTIGNELMDNFEELVNLREENNNLKKQIEELKKKSD